MQPQSKIQALFLGVLLPYIALVMFFARRHQGQPLPTWLIYLGIACIVAIIVGSLIVRRTHVGSMHKEDHFFPTESFQNPSGLSSISACSGSVCDKDMHLSPQSSCAM